MSHRPQTQQQIQQPRQLQQARLLTAYDPLPSLHQDQPLSPTVCSLLSLMTCLRRRLGRAPVRQPVTWCLHPLRLHLARQVLQTLKEGVRLLAPPHLLRQILPIP